MLHDSSDPLVKNAQSSIITVWKWKAKIIGTVANGKAGLDLHPQCWWSKEFTINKRKIVSEEMDHVEEVTHIATL